MKIDFLLNGKQVFIDTDPLKSLLEVIREDMKLTGIKEGCAEGECGACSVFLDGKLVNSCIIPAIQVHNRKVVTIEGLRRYPFFNEIIKAFEEAGAVQCGFCIPGFIMATVNFLANIKDWDIISNEDIKESLSGNLCRCTGYVKIIDAVRILEKYKVKIPKEIL